MASQHHVVLVSAVLIAGSVNGGGVSPFTEEAVERGIEYVVQEWPQPVGYFGFGSGFADLDADGDPDLIVLGAADGAVGLYENDGRGFFSRVLTSGIASLPEASAVAAGDYDGDGDLDLYLTQMELPNRLLRNDGDFTFADVTAFAGVGDAGPGKAASFGDLDGDGWLDLYVCNYTFPTPPGAAPPNRMYRNLGDGTFEEISGALGVDDEGVGFQSVFTDYDRDGDVDLYLSNDRGHQLDLPNRLWQNNGGTLTDVSVASGAGVALYSMGVACGDFDGNGWPDLYCTNIPGGGEMNNPLLLNQGDGTFVEGGVEAGVDNPWTSWGSIFFDFDDDGDLDLYVNNMWDPNTLFVNPGGEPCTDAASDLGVSGSGALSFASAVADVDGDGDLDLFLSDLGQRAELFINREGDRRASVRYRIVGCGANTFAIGANVDTRVGTAWHFREVIAGGNGYCTQNELTLHVGLGAAKSADEVVVSWPGGSPVRTLTNLPADEAWTIYPPQRLGDVDGDGVVDMSDFTAFGACLATGFAAGCEMMDFDGNSVLDVLDVDAFVESFGVPLVDCDEDGEPDIREILLDPALDVDGDGALDDCTIACSGDVDGDGDVGFSDLLRVLAAWGPCPGCETDLDGDGVVGFVDLLTTLSAWGPCL